LFCRNGLLYPLLFCCILDFSDSGPCVNNFPTNDHHCSLTSATSVQFNCNWILNPKLQPLHIHMSHYLTEFFLSYSLRGAFYMLKTSVVSNLLYAEPALAAKLDGHIMIICVSGMNFWGSWLLWNKFHVLLNIMENIN
jgi:hypothetical protein